MGFAHAPINVSWAMRYPNDHCYVDGEIPFANLSCFRRTATIRILMFANVFDFWRTRQTDWRAIKYDSSAEKKKSFAVLCMFSMMNLRLFVFNRFNFV